MDIIKVLYENKINDIPLMQFYQSLTDPSNGVICSGTTLVIFENSKRIPIRCIREYYCDPNTNKKMPKVNLANPCGKIRSAFGISDCYNCVDCHKKMVEDSLIGKQILYKK